MNSSIRIVASILIALIFGGTVPSGYASAADARTPVRQRDSIGTPKAGGGAEFATETARTPLISRKHHERRASESSTSPASFDLSPQPRALARVSSPSASPEFAANDAVRGRAPPSHLSR